MVIWVMGIIQAVKNIDLLSSIVVQDKSTDAANDDSSSNWVTFGELTGMAVPSALALCVMYRLVPYHWLILCFTLALHEQFKWRREQRG